MQRSPTRSSLVPTEYAKRTQRVPATWLANRFVEWKGKRLVVSVVEKPSTVRLTPTLHETQSFGDAGIWLVPLKKPDVPEVIKRTQDVVAIPRWKGELQEVRVRDVAGGKPPEECAFEQVLLASSPGCGDLRC